MHKYLVEVKIYYRLIFILAIIYVYIFIDLDKTYKIYVPMYIVTLN